MMAPVRLNDDYVESTSMIYLKYPIVEGDWNPSGTLDSIIQCIPRANQLDFWKTNDFFPKIRVLNMILSSVDISSSAAEKLINKINENVVTGKHDILSSEIPKKRSFKRCSHKNQIKIFKQSK